MLAGSGSRRAGWSPVTLCCRVWRDDQAIAQEDRVGPEGGYPPSWQDYAGQVEGVGGGQPDELTPALGARDMAQLVERLWQGVLLPGEP